MDKEECREILEYAIECRRRVKEQLRKMTPGEFSDVDLGYIDLDTEAEIVVGLPEIANGTLVFDGFENAGYVYGVGRSVNDILGIYRLENKLIDGTGVFSFKNVEGLARAPKSVKDSINAAFNYFTENARKLMNGLVTKMGINLPGTGIALTIPVQSIAGNASLMYLAEGQSITSDEVKNMSETHCSLLVIICEKGYSDMVMDAARAAGAGGGTVVHGKGTANEFTAKFFGVSIAAEKEIIYIVSKTSGKDAIMKSIIQNAGPATEARAAVFSLPVEDVAGLSSVMDKD